MTAWIVGIALALLIGYWAARRLRQALRDMDRIFIEELGRRDPIDRPRDTGGAS